MTVRYNTEGMNGANYNESFSSMLAVCDNFTRNTTPEHYLASATCLMDGYVYPDPPYPPWGIGLLGFMAGLTSFVTTGGNILVVMAFVLEKNLREPSNYLIASLAVTDILIGMFSMPFYTLYLLKKYWPLGQIICDLWLSMDYTACLVSQYTVFLITLDRYFSVKAPAKYRNWKSAAKIKIMIAITWLVPAFIFFVTILGWRKLTGTEPPSDCTCAAEFQTNPLFTVILVLSYYWVTLLIMIGLYIEIYRVALSLHTKARKKRNRFRKMKSLASSNVNNSETDHLSVALNAKTTGEENTNTNRNHSKRRNPSTVDHQMAEEESDFSVEPTSSDSGYSKKCDHHDQGIATAQCSVRNKTTDSPLWKPRCSLNSNRINWNAFSQDMDNCNIQQSESGNLTAENCDEQEILRSTPTKCKTLGRMSQMFSLIRIRQCCATSSSANEEPKTGKSKSRSTNASARKALRTITLILGAFVICWTPYHVVVIIHSFCNCVDVTFYEFTYWLCYMNSPLNPFCYALSNQQFKRTFINIIQGKYFKCRRSYSR